MPNPREQNCSGQQELRPEKDVNASEWFEVDEIAQRERNSGNDHEQKRGENAANQKLPLGRLILAQQVEQPGAQPHALLLDQNADRVCAQVAAQHAPLHEADFLEAQVEHVEGHDEVDAAVEHSSHWQSKSFRWCTVVQVTKLAFQQRLHNKIDDHKNKRSII